MAESTWLPMKANFSFTYEVEVFDSVDPDVTPDDIARQEAADLLIRFESFLLENVDTHEHVNVVIDPIFQPVKPTS